MCTSPAQCGFQTLQQVVVASSTMVSKSVSYGPRCEWYSVSATKDGSLTCTITVSLAKGMGIV